MNPKNKTPKMTLDLIVSFSKIMTHREVCAELGVSRSTVYRTLRDAGLNASRDLVRSKLDARAESIKQDITNGLNRKQIAAKCGVSITAIENFCRARKIPLPDTRKTNASHMRELEADIPLIYAVCSDLTPAELADKWDVPVEVMRLFLRKHKFETKKAPSK